MPNQSKQQRRKAWRWGIDAELFAILALIIRGHRIIAKRYRTMVGEIDLIATRGMVLIFVEVKARRTISDGMNSIGPRQQQRIVRAAQWYLQRQRKFANHHIRFDAIIVAPWRWPRHVKDAWRPDGIR
jgi:putative endonuclease